LTDLDGKNILGVVKEDTEITYYFSLGFVDIIAHQHMFVSQNSTIEDDVQIPSRSKCIISELRLEVLSNAFGGNTSFGLRKNGDGGNNTDKDIHTFPLTGGQTGIFEPPVGTEFSYEKDDLISFGFVESEPNVLIRYKISCTIEWLAR